MRTQNVQEAKEKLLTLDLEVTLQYAKVNLCVSTLKFDHFLQKYCRYTGFCLMGSSAMCLLVKLCDVMTIDLCCVSDHLTHLYGPTLLIEDTLVEGAYNNQGFKSEVGSIPLLPRSIINY